MDVWAVVGTHCGSFTVGVLIGVVLDGVRQRRVDVNRLIDALRETRAIATRVQNMHEGNAVAKCIDDVRNAMSALTHLRCRSEHARGQAAGAWSFLIALRADLEFGMTADAIEAGKALHRARHLAEDYLARLSTANV